MKRFLTAVIAAILALSLSLPAFAFNDTYYTVPLIYETDTMPELPLPTYPAPDPFTDCHDELIILAWACGIVDGSGGEFRPLGTLTKAEWAQMLYNAFGPNFPHEPRPAGKPWHYQAATWLEIDDTDLAASAGYDWCIETAYRLWCRGSKIDFVASDAATWALERGAGISDSWRITSNTGAASGQFFTRAEAVALLIRLGELELNPLG